MPFPTCFCSLNSGLRAFTDKGPFELGHCSHHMKKQGAAGRVGRNIFGERFELDILLFEVGNQVDELTKRASQSIKAPYDKDAALLEAAQGSLEPRALEGRSRDALIAEDDLAACAA